MHLYTNDIREKAIAYERAVFNIIFNNRDDHPKNFSYLMSKDGNWKLAPAYDVTFCEGSGGYHQMDVVGQALEITYKDLILLGKTETLLSLQEIKMIIEKICDVGNNFSAIAKENYADQITNSTLTYIQSRINQNISRFK